MGFIENEDKMSESTNLLAYCGFYCGDCLGYTGVVANAAESLLHVLQEYMFERTAECVFPQQLEKYDGFLEILRFMTELRCSGICREDQQDRPPPTCVIKNCCRSRGYYACYECASFEACDNFASVHHGLHTDSCIRNMRAIKEMGLEAWIAKGPRHHYWDRPNECP
jgi:hypothetical protein